MTETIVATLFLGSLLFLCLLFGRGVTHLKIPKVTGYLLAGIALSPSVLSLFSQPLSQMVLDSLGNLRFVSDLALGLIAFTIGGEFQNERFKKMGNRILIVSLCETAVTFSIVFTALFLFSSNLSLSLCLGILAIATAPAATLLVLREYDSEGVVTNSLLILTGLNNIVCLMLFSLSVPLFFSPDQQGGTGSTGMLLLVSLASVLQSLILGFILGFLLSIFENRITKPAERIVITLATIILGIGLAKLSGVSPLLVNLVVGVTVINLARKAEVVFNDLKLVDLPLYAAFFGLSGADLHWDSLVMVGAVGLLYCTGRIAGKILGVTSGAARAGFGSTLKKYGGVGLLSQAGVALGLALIIQERNPALGEIVSTTILSTVIVFEILGPIALRWSIVRSGEVKIINVIHRDEGAPFRESLREIVNRLRSALGIPLWKGRGFSGEICVEHIMRKHIEVIHEETHFDQILKVIEHSRYNLFPVVNEAGEFTGIISFQDIRDVLYDGMMKDLVIAKDIANPPGFALNSKATIAEALDVFEAEKVDVLPVIDDTTANHLLGIVTQRDLLAAFKGKKD